jgi:hypothetical protein
MFTAVWARNTVMVGNASLSSVGRMGPVRISARVRVAAVVGAHAPAGNFIAAVPACHALVAAPGSKAAGISSSSQSVLALSIGADFCRLIISPIAMPAETICSDPTVG